MTSRLSWRFFAGLGFGVALLGLGAYGAIRLLEKEPAPVEKVSPGSEPGPQALARQAHDVLQTNCHRCHGQDGAMEGGFNYVLDRQRLVERRKIVPGQPEQSPLLRRILAGEMPPQGEKHRPSPDETAILQKWIAAGALDFTPSGSPRQSVPLAGLPRLINEDLARLPERDRRFARYFTLAHLRNAGLADDELQTHRQALGKLVNSLSWGRDIVSPRPVDADKTLLRIDLRDYKWEGATWERLLTMYPYGSVTDDEIGRAMTAATDCRLPYLRADWFTAIASRPPLYYDLLQMPATERELETLLRVDAARDIRGERVVRAGFSNSGVSRNNRIVERYDSGFGAYWKSYDFAGGTGTKNIFASPLGPGAGPHSFQHDGGEMIFELPNHLHAYLLVDGAGKRMDQAPTAIVSDPKRPERAAVAGLSCMSCHSRGLNDKADQVREHVQKNPKAFPAAEAETILALYAPRERFEGLLRADTDRYRQALEKTGARWGVSDPIETLAARFEADVDLRLASAEVGVSPKELGKAIADVPELGRVGALRPEGGTVGRRVFADSFGDLLKALNRGEPLRPGGLTLPPALKERTVFDLPEPFSDVRTGGSGRFLIFYLKKAKKLAIFDVLQAKIVHEIDLPTEDVRFAAGKDKLLVVLTGEKVVQRWDLRTFTREKIVPVPNGMKVDQARMGYNSAGPLALWGGGPVVLMDVDRMEPMEVEGGGLGGGAQWGFHLRVSPNGQVFVSWENNISPTPYTVMRLSGRKATVRRLGSGGANGLAWVMPDADGSNLIEGIEQLRSANFDAYPTPDLKGSTLLATADPRFFLAASGLNCSICTTSDRRRVLTLSDKALEGMGVGFPLLRWFLFEREEARIRYLPEANTLAMLPMSNKQIVVRPFNLMEELDRESKEYLFVLSLPKAQVKAGSVFQYQLDVKSKAAGVTYTLEKGPEGMTVSASGEVRWNVPPAQAGKTTPVIISVKNAAGKELFHTFDLVAD